MANDIILTVRIDSELHDEFFAEAELAHRPAAQMVRDLMREFIAKQKEERAKSDYDKWREAEVEISRAEFRAGLSVPSEEVEAHFAARRAKALAK